MKYLFVTGGVISSLGKGLTSACLALLMESRGLKVSIMKFDPYLNVDPGTMSPYQHGEVYVTDDGAETDLDLGHYWRYSHSYIGRESSVSSGQIFNDVIANERRGDYLGKTVQMIPHITDEIKRRIHLCASKAAGDLLIIEIGGTAGDIEAMTFFEAIRQFRQEYPGNTASVHLTYVPYVKAAGELKTKPTQQSVQILREIGLMPDILICRGEMALPQEVKEKIALFCSVPVRCVIDEPDVKKTLLEIPEMLHLQQVDQILCDKLSIQAAPCDLTKWQQLVTRSLNPIHKLKLALVGKYGQQADAYKSIYESLKHAALHLDIELEVIPCDSENIHSLEDCRALLSGMDGCLIPGGFGARGWEGKLQAIRYCRENKLPLFGICLGMQAICVEWARNVLHIDQANSSEFDPETPHPVIALLGQLRHSYELGGTMRLGSYPMALRKGSQLEKIYQKSLTHERHRHRYELNNAYKEQFESSGLQFSAHLENGLLCEAVEVPQHPWMIGVQYHPEFISRVTDPHPLFTSLLQAMLAQASLAQNGKTSTKTTQKP